MKRFCGAGLAVVLAVTVLWADDRTKLYSDPSPPPREVLDRLNLKQEWTTFVPMDGRKDGFSTVQLLDGQMFVQTRSGMVAALNAETGRMLWHTTFGKAYQASFPLAINTTTILAANGGTIYALDRDTGSVRWKFRQPEGLSTAPVVDDVQMYLSTGSGRMSGYFLPTDPRSRKPEPSTPAPPKAEDRLDTPAGAPYASPAADKEALGLREPQPTFAWDAQTNARLEFPPLVGYGSLLVASPTGNVVIVSKFPANNYVSQTSLKLDGQVAVPPAKFEDVLKNGQVDDLAYIGGQDASVYALSIADAKLRWRFPVGTAVMHTPVATADDVFVTAERNGMYRLSRTTGEPQWRIKRGNRNVESNPDADRFLAVNPKFVYAADKSGRLLVLDRTLGTEISSYDTRDFAFPIANDMNDRLFLMANNGLIVCLHDKEYTKPYFHQRQSAGGAGRTPEDRIQIVKDNLGRKITHAGYPDPMPLREALDKFRKTYTLQIFASDRVFTTANLAPINDKLVNVPKVENVVLGDYIKQILGQVGATYELTADVLQVIPLKALPPADKGQPPADKAPPVGAGDKDKPDVAPPKP